MFCFSSPTEGNGAYVFFIMFAKGQFHVESQTQTKKSACPKETNKHNDTKGIADVL